MLNTVYYKEEMPKGFSKSLFLAGGTSRNYQEVSSWRETALQILDHIGYDGVVFIPEFRDKEEKYSSHEEYIEWEEKYLECADVILFWVPRDLSLDSKQQLKLPCFTTNIEFGKYINSGKVVFGAPEDAEKVSYMKYYVEKYDITVNQTLTETIREALNLLGDGSPRQEGECFIPLNVWKLPTFQEWYQAHKQAGNILHDARVLYTFKPDHKTPFLWIVKANIWIKEENRFKSNEFVLSRPNLNTLMLWKKSDEILDSEVLLIKEFRTPANTKDGFIRELISGSSNIIEELKEETGFSIEESRLQNHSNRQLMGTFSAHKSNLYSALLTDEEMNYFKSNQNKPFGLEKDSERTYIETYTIKDLLNNNLTDWSTLGQIFSVIN